MSHTYRLYYYHALCAIYKSYLKLKFFKMHIYSQSRCRRGRRLAKTQLNRKMMDQNLLEGASRQNPPNPITEIWNVSFAAWRLSTLVLLCMAIFFGFLSLVSETVEICLDATRTFTCLKIMSGLSLITLVLASKTLIC